MLLQYLLSNPILIFPVLASIIIAFSFHEFSHAAMAEWLGDPTPKSLGRLTLNPLAHIHAIGFVLLITFGFGWGKPVPFNPRYLKNPKWGAALIGLAGPFSNLLLAVLCTGILWYLANFTLLSPNSLLTIFLVFLIQFNVVLMVFNLIPIPPLDGSKLLFALIPAKYDHLEHWLSQYGPMILLGLIFFDAFSSVSIFSGLFQFFLSGVDRLLLL